MTLDNLPSDWPARSLADPELAADVLDLFVTDRDRQIGGFAILRCSSDGRLQQPEMVCGSGARDQQHTGDPVLQRAIHLCTAPELQPGQHRRLGTVDTGLAHAHSPPAREQTAAHGSLVLGIVRAYGPLVDSERAWHQRAIQKCRHARVPLLGVHLVTRAGVRVLPAPLDRRGRRTPGLPA